MDFPLTVNTNFSGVVWNIINPLFICFLAPRFQCKRLGEIIEPLFQMPENKIIQNGPDF